MNMNGNLALARSTALRKLFAWYNSPAYEALKPIRLGASVSRMFLADGLPPQ